MGLAAELARLFANESIIEMGAGKGCYSSFFRRDKLRREPQIQPPRVRAFDGSTNVGNQTGELEYLSSHSVTQLAPQSARSSPRSTSPTSHSSPFSLTTHSSELASQPISRLVSCLHHWTPTSVLTALLTRMALCHPTLHPETYRISRNEAHPVMQAVWCIPPIYRPIST